MNSTQTSLLERLDALANQSSSASVRTVRSLFVSDLHMGSRYARVNEFLELLNRHQPEHLFLVGDFLDARALRLSPHWSPRYDAIFNRLAEMSAEGTRIHYTPGNHDDYLRHVTVAAGDVAVRDEFLHTTVDGRHVVVLHGDQFDQVEHRAHWLSLFGSVLYTMLLAVDRGMNRCLRSLHCKPRRLSRFLKQTTKRFVQWLSGFETKVFQHASSRQCDVIVCGHIHIPSVRRFPGRLYFNLGDWVENTTALVEYADGELELIDLEKQMQAAGHLYDWVQPPASEVHLTDRAKRMKESLLAGI